MSTLWRTLRQKLVTGSIWQIPLQLCIYIGLYLLAGILVNILHLPLPANVVGLGILLLLIMLRIIPVKWIRAGGNWLLAEMLLFFIPAVVAVVNYGPLLRTEGWKIVAVIALSTVLVLAATGCVVERVFRYEMSRAQRQLGSHDE
ncbi:CidA/LrgA family protein [Rosenbergiella australiborealis]|uniref:CidA/LrgA family protein n=1 Tax=Rosenbergiella australiborealis TaxID=1544696 RepID=A0ABS5T0U3_9GAMM|nr:CidA/LrgA family protein [Rosenbergiella australiborealis]MBT0725956.1 CidA/LrgA family protein [Rosenbergiella australiborealis]